MKRSPGWVASQVLAASIGGYVVTSVAASALALLLIRMPGWTRADAVQLATLLGFVIYTAVVIQVFSGRSALRVWRGLAIEAAAGGLVLLALRAA